jgi:hypothetical protein
MPSVDTLLMKNRMHHRILVFRSCAQPNIFRNPRISYYMLLHPRKHPGMWAYQI